MEFAQSGRPFLAMTPLMSLILPIRAVRRFAVAAALAALAAACGQSPQAQPQAGPPPPAVTVAKPVQQQVTDYDEYVGRFTAVNSVEVRARVSGYLEALHFKDGQLVKQGDLLFTDRQAPVPERARPGARQSGAGEVERRLHQGRSRARPAIAARQDHHRPDLRAALAGRAQRAKPPSPTPKRRCARPSSICNSPSCARRSTAASATAACRRATW